MKKIILVTLLLLSVVLVGCNTDSSNQLELSDPAEINSMTNEKTPTESDPPESISIRSQAELDEMRRMLQRSDKELEAYLQHIEGGGAHSREDIESFLKIVDSLPVLRVIDGELAWIGYYRDSGVAMISTLAPNGNWSRIEYRLAIEDTTAELERLRKNGEFDRSTLSDVIQSKDGRVKVFSEIRDAHSSGNGETITWMTTVDNILVQVVYSVSDTSNVQGSEIFEEIEIFSISPST